MKRWKQVLVSAGLMAAMEVSSVYAAGWQWLDNNNDGVSECYYIQDDGTALLGTVTPDGHTVDEQGAWIVDGVVQTQNTEPAQAMEPASPGVPCRPASWDSSGTFCILPRIPQIIWPWWSIYTAMALETS